MVGHKQGRSTQSQHHPTLSRRRASTIRPFLSSVLHWHCHRATWVHLPAWQAQQSLGIDYATALPPPSTRSMPANPIPSTPSTRRGRPQHAQHDSISTKKRVGPSPVASDSATATAPPPLPSCSSVKRARRRGWPGRASAGGRGARRAGGTAESPTSGCRVRGQRKRMRGLGAEAKLLGRRRRILGNVGVDAIRARPAAG